jgi:hypothetical protein
MLQVGMALHSLGPEWREWALVIWKTWSERSPKHDEEELLHCWQGFKDDRAGKVTMGSLMMWAKAAGWKPQSTPKEVRELLNIANSGRAQTRLQELDDRFFVVRNDGGKCVVAEVTEDRDGVQIYNSMLWRDWTPGYNNEFMPDVDGKKPVPLGNYWFSTKAKRYDGVALEPEGKLVLPGNIFNLYRGRGRLAQKGDWRLLAGHIYRVLANGDKQTFEYILRWMAWGLQNPGKPAQAAIVFRGEEGTGKGLLARAYAELFKPHVHMARGLDSVAGQFNKSLKTSLFVFVDEAAVTKGYRDSFFSLITEPTISIREMRRDYITAYNRLKIMMSSNHDFVVPAGPNARRFVVSDVNNYYAENGECPKKERKDYFDALYREMDNGGIEAMMHDLLAIQLNDWHPRQIVYNKSLSLQKQITLQLDPLDNWFWHGLVAEGRLPNNYGGNRPSNTVLASRLLDEARAYSDRGAREINPTSLGRFLAKHGCTKKCESAGNVWVFPTLLELREKEAAQYGFEYDDGGTEWNEVKEPAPAEAPATAPTFADVADFNKWLKNKDRSSARPLQ